MDCDTFKRSGGSRSYLVVKIWARLVIDIPPSVISSKKQLSKYSKYLERARTELGITTTSQAAEVKARAPVSRADVFCKAVASVSSRSTASSRAASTVSAASTEVVPDIKEMQAPGPQQTSMDEHGDRRISSQHRAHINRLIGDFIYGQALPFSVLESD
eukprot:736729-Rhodomonas_salina.1